MRVILWCGVAAAALVAAAPVMADPAAAPLQGEESRGVRILAPDDTGPPPIPPKAPAATPPPPKVPLRAPVIQACQRPFAAPDLKLDDKPGFERRLGGKLRLRRRVVVDLAVPYGEKAAAPAALAPWLAEIQASGGTVQVKPYCEGTRSLFGDWLAELFATKPANPYRAARRYDAVLHADALDHVITQVEFTPRGATKP